MAIKTTLIGFDYLSADIVAEISRNLTTLFSTPAGSCPGDRSFGINPEIIDLPADVARNRLAVEIAEKLAEYEPRAEVEDITSEIDEDGTLFTRILIGPNEEYDEDEDEETEEEEEDE